jgi:prevent-host-death family protein
MNLPQITPISDMRIRIGEVMGKLQKGPVILAQHSRPAAVLVSIADWEKIADELAELKQMRRAVEYERQFAAARAGNYVDLDDLDQLDNEQAASNAHPSNP